MTARNLVKLVVCFFFLASTNLAFGVQLKTSSENQVKTVNQGHTGIVTKQAASPPTVAPAPVFQPIRATSKEVAPKSVVNFLKYEVANKKLSADQMARVRDSIQKLGRGTVNMDKPNMPMPGMPGMPGGTGGMTSSPKNSESSCTKTCCVKGYDCSYSPCQEIVYCYPTDCEDGC